jgi:hypothetical protein
MNKEQIISEINKIRNNLDGPPSKLESQVDKILGLLINLIDFVKAEDPENSNLQYYMRAKEDLSHTLEKEVGYTFQAYSETQKKNAANKRNTEYRQELDNAIERINSDLNYFF